MLISGKEANYIISPSKLNNAVREGKLGIYPPHNPPGAFTKPPLLQESRHAGGDSPNLVGLVEWKSL